MRRRPVEVVVQLLHVLAVIPFRTGQAEETLFQDGIAAVPHRQREAQDLPIVADPADAVLAPAIRAASRMIVRKGIPRRPVDAVILANGSPLALAEVRPPFP